MSDHITKPEILKLTLKIQLVADKIDDDQPLSRGEKNLAKNILREHAETLLRKSMKASGQKKSDDPVKVKRREAMLKYRTKRTLAKLMEGKD